MVNLTTVKLNNYNCNNDILPFSLYYRNDSGQEDNIWHGFCCVVVFFLVISLLAFPNGKKFNSVMCKKVNY